MSEEETEKLIKEVVQNFKWKDPTPPTPKK